jgi:hypothetical protein
VPVLVLLGALAVLAGCSTSAASTAKTDSARTTVAADANSAAQTSSAADVNLSAAKLRLIDPCGLLDAATMAQFGSPQPSTSAGIDACNDDVSDGRGNDLNVTVTVGSDLSDYNPTGTIAGLPAAEDSDSTACFDRLVTQRDPVIGIEIQADYDKNPSCPVARELAQLVVAHIRSSPPQRADGAGSLATVDPCDTIDDATAAAVDGGTPGKRAEGLYRCEWQNDGTGFDLTVEFSLDQDPKDDATNGPPQPVDIGVPAYQSSSDDVYPTCDVKWMITSVGDGFGEVVDVEFGDVENGAVDACAQAVTAAKAVATKVPKAS